MKIKKIELKNWGPHKHLVLDMDASVVGIVGANGKGKSNLLQAIDYAFTANLNKQKSEKYIRNFGQPDGATSASVHIEFEKGGKKGVISRTITSTASKRSLEWDGESWNKAADVEKKLEDILGTDKASLANAVFIKQGELSNLVKGTPSERHTIFQKLMNLQFLEPRADDVQSKLSAIRGSLQDFRPLLQDINRDIEESESRLKEFDQYDIEKSLEDHTKAIASLEKLLTYHELYQLAKSSIETIRENKSSLKASISQTVASYGVTNYDELNELVNNLIKDLEACNAELTVLQNASKDWSNKLNLQETLQNTEANIAEAESHILSEEQLATTKQVLEEMERAVEFYKASSELAEQMKAALQESKAVGHECRDAYNNSKPRLEENIKNANIQLTQEKIKLHATDIKILSLSTPTECPVCGSSISADTLRLPGETDEQLLIRLKDSKRQADRNIADINAIIGSATKELRILESDALKEDMRDTHCQNEIQKISKRMMEFDKSKPPVIFTEEMAVTSIPSIQQAILEHEKSCATVNQLRTMKDVLTQQLEALKDVQCPDETAINRLKEKASNIRYNLQTRQGGLKTLSSLIGRLELLVTQESEESDRVDTHVKDIFEFWNDKSEAGTIDELRNLWCLYQDEEVYDRNSKAHCTMMFDRLSNEIFSLRDRVAVKHTEEWRLNKLKSKLSDLKILIAQNNDKQRLIDDLQIIKSMLSRNGVPLAFMNDVFTKITGMVQEMLNRMGANFNVLPDPDRPCSFVFVRNDNNTGFEMVQEQLSGGQAIRLALALLLSCQQVILPEVGLLVLDEPSSHIDSEGVENMRDLFLSLQDILNNADMQVIMVDHNEKLMTAFDKTIELK